MKFLRDLFGGREERQHYQVNDDSPEMVAAMAEAKRTLPSFWLAYEDPELRPSCIVKLRLTGEGGVEEHVWVSDITRRDGVASGLLANEPLSLAPLVYCSEVTIETDRISDWQYLKDQKVWGAFTQRAILLTLPEAEAAAMRGIFSSTPVEEAQ